MTCNFLVFGTTCFMRFHKVGSYLSLVRLKLCTHTLWLSYHRLTIGKWFCGASDQQTHPVASTLDQVDRLCMQHIGSATAIDLHKLITNLAEHKTVLFESCWVRQIIMLTWSGTGAATDSHWYYRQNALMGHRKHNPGIPQGVVGWDTYSSPPPTPLHPPKKKKERKKINKKLNILCWTIHRILWCHLLWISSH